MLGFHLLVCSLGLSIIRVLDWNPNQRHWMWIIQQEKPIVLEKLLFSMMFWISLYPSCSLFSSHLFLSSSIFELGLQYDDCMLSKMSITIKSFRCSISYVPWKEEVIEKFSAFAVSLSPSLYQALTEGITPGSKSGNFLCILNSRILIYDCDKNSTSLFLDFAWLSYKVKEGYIVIACVRFQLILLIMLLNCTIAVNCAP